MKDGDNREQPYTFLVPRDLWYRFKATVNANTNMKKTLISLVKKHVEDFEMRNGEKYN